MSNSRKALHSSDSVEWYTPEKYCAAARNILGNIDLDPASCSTANEKVKADEYLTKKDDGLSTKWHGKIFLNPPYGYTIVNGKQKSSIKIWTWRALAQYEKSNIEEGILLLNATTERSWFQPLWNFPICFTDHRIRFIDKHGNKQKNPTHGNVFIYLCESTLKAWKFKNEFDQFGHVVIPRK